MLGITVVYIFLQWGSHLQIGSAEWLPDSVDYIFPASYDWNDPNLWTHTKPWGTAILYKLTGTSPLTIDAVQTALSTLAWLSLAWVFSSSISANWLKMTAYAMILGFSLAPSLQMWNHIIQSESLSISLMAFILAVWILLLQRWRWAKFFPLVFLFTWWTGTRETNVYLSLLIAGILVFIGQFYRQQRFYWAISVVLIISSYVNLQISEKPTIPRWLYPLTNIVLHRILPDESFLRYFEAKGMPVSPALLELSGGFANSGDFAVFNNTALDEVEFWLNKRGKEVYIRFLIDHPVYTLASPWQYTRDLLASEEIQSYAPENYHPFAAWLFEGLLFPRSLWLVLLLALAVLVSILTIKPWHISRVFWLAIGLLILCIPHFYLVWHGDAAEVGRHAIQASIQLRLSLWMLLLLSLDTIAFNRKNRPHLIQSATREA